MKQPWESEIVVEDLPENLACLAEEIGLKNTLKVMRLFEGGEVYFPKFDGAFKRVRDAVIRRRWRKHNLSDLSREYGLTENHIRNIVADHEAQADLFLDN